MTEDTRSNLQIYCDLRSSYDMVVPNDAVLGTYRSSIAPFDAVDINRAFHRIAQGIHQKGEKLQRFDTRLTWWAVKDEINKMQRDVAHEAVLSSAADVCQFKCPKCPRTYEGLRWMGAWCKKDDVTMVEVEPKGGE